MGLGQSALLDQKLMNTPGFPIRKKVELQYTGWRSGGIPMVLLALLLSKILASLPLSVSPGWL